MKVEIFRWGPVERCEFDLTKNLLIIYGDNNIGKSYAMQTLYLLLKNLLEYAKRYGRLGVSHRGYYSDNKNVRALVTQFADNPEKQEEEITEQLVDIYVRQLEQEWLPELTHSFENTFGTFARIRQEQPFIHMELNSNIECDIRPGEERISLHLEQKPIYLKRTTSDFHKSRDSRGRFDIYVFDNRVDTPIRLARQKLQDIAETFACAIRSIARAVYFLPASRSGIYTGMNSFGPILAQLSQNRSYIRGNINIQIPSIPEPISDYYMALSSIRPDDYARFTDIAGEIERNILKGEVRFDNKTKSIVYVGENTEDPLEMSDVASMVSEISPITAYLKYIVNRGTGFIMRETPSENPTRPDAIIFIEEPEAHLHPRNQVELMKIFARLAKQNVKLIMASHSNYVFNELNNLVLGRELDSDVYAPILMRQEGKRSSTCYMKMDELGVSDENFADVAEELYEEREGLIQKLMQELQQEYADDTEN